MTNNEFSKNAGEKKKINKHELCVDIPVRKKIKF